MQLNKERADAVVHAIEHDARAEESSKYSFAVFCKEHNLFSSEDRHRAGEVMICCPFHGDNNPSLSINEGKRIWNCLGCGRGGGYIKFRQEYDNVILNRKYSVYDEINSILKSDPVLQAQLGFGSIFMSGSDINGFEKIEIVPFRFKGSRPSTWPELATKIQNSKLGTNAMIYAILAMQTGLSIDVVYDTLFKGDGNVSKQKKYDLADMSKEEEC